MLLPQRYGVEQRVEIGWRPGEPNPTKQGIVLKDGDYPAFVAEDIVIYIRAGLDFDCVGGSKQGAKTPSVSCHFLTPFTIDSATEEVSS
ncbi:hypothetical protein BH09VER1_BH09VER1_37440 [soil metagenome]